MIAFLYRALTDIGAWPVRAWLQLRAWRGKEERLRLGERRGVTQIPRPPGKLIWCHAASVGESTAVLPLITQLQQRDGVAVLLTTGTASSARIMAERLPENVIHQFAPWDRRAWISRFLDHWQPDLAVRMESEVWPNTIQALRDGGVPVAVISGRLSDATVSGWQRAKGFAGHVFGSVNLVLAQSDDHAARFSALGAPDVEVGGNLKLASGALPVPPRALAALRSAVGDRPVWLAASTHPGEDEIAFDTHLALKQKIGALLTVVAPRHPQGRDDIEGAAKARGLRSALRSRRELPGAETDVYVADTFGELGVLFSIAPVVFMGKSLTAHGGQNPLEPLHFGCAVVFGPHMENFEDLAPAMTARGIAVQIDTPQALANTVEDLLQNELARTTMNEAGNKLLEDGVSILDVTLKAMDDLLSKTTTHPEPHSDGR